MKIAIVGSGISGLVCAHHLHPAHDITLFEANHYIGGHTNTVDIEIGDQTFAVDTGFIVFNDRNYPHFRALLNQLGIQSVPTSMSFSVKDCRNQLEYCGSSINKLFGQRRNLLKPSFYKFIAEIFRFNSLALKLANALPTDLTVDEFIKEYKFSSRFVDDYLYPMGSAIWSCSFSSFGRFPIRFITQFYRNHGLLGIRNRPQWHTIPGGARNYVNAIVRKFAEKIRTNSPVEKVHRLPRSVQLFVKGQPPETFDHIIFACHADQALRILGDDSTASERTVLSTFRYSRNVATLHTDHSILPKRRRTWASWNYMVGNQNDAPPCVTYNMNILQHIPCTSTICITLNGEDLVRPDCIHRSFVYHHPIFSVEREQARLQHKNLLNQRHTSFCGAYWGNGFHEDGVVSALNVVDAIGSSSTSSNSEMLDPRSKISSDDGVLAGACDE